MKNKIFIATFLILILSFLSVSCTKDEGYTGKFYKVGTYDFVGPLMDIGDKLTFIAKRDGNVFIVHNGKEFGEEYFKELDNEQLIYYGSDIIDIKGKLAFVANKEKKFLIYDGKKVSKEYDDIKYLTKVGNKPAFLAVDSSKYFIVYDNNEVFNFDGYIYGDGPVEIDNRLAFSAAKELKVEPYYKGIIFYESEKQGKDFDIFGEEYDDSTRVFNVNDKLTFVAKEGDKQLVVHNSVEGKKYDEIGWIEEINGKLAYSARIGEEWVFVFDNKEGEKYDALGYETYTINDEVAYIAKKAGKWFIIINDKPLEPGSDYYPTVFVLNNKIGFIEETPINVYSSEFAIVYDNKKIGTEYNGMLAFPIVIGDKLAYEVFTGFESFIVYDNKEVDRDGNQFKMPSQNLKNIGGKLTYKSTKMEYIGEKPIEDITDLKDINIKQTTSVFMEK
ncbi:hypothetical protein HYT58_00670 [Candidatus Woesearchaeota archaeon]|nr:hypothetical protein [Candidatus Woesearchaeota archaeon]